jgi:site-specific DNA-cytosine methylase
MGCPNGAKGRVLVAHKGEKPPANFPSAPTHAIPVSAGESLRGCDGREGRAISGAMLEKVRMRVAMTREQVGAMGCRPRNDYCVMDLTELAWTLTSCFTNPSGGRYIVKGESEGGYRCLSINEGDRAALQSFYVGYHFCGTKMEAKRMVGNAVPPKLAEAITWGLICVTYSWKTFVVMYFFNLYPHALQGTRREACKHLDLVG